jgi:hypothetical protein
MAKETENLLQLLAAIAGIVGAIPVLWVMFKFVVKKMVKPVRITLLQGEVTREAGDESLGLHVRLQLKSANYNTNNIHDFHPLLHVANRYENVHSVQLNGVQLSTAGYSFTYQMFAVDTQVIYMLISDMYKIDLQSDFKDNIHLRITYSVDYKTYTEQFSLSYIYLGS